MTRLRTAIIGCGRMGTAHLSNLQTFDDVDVVAVCDADPTNLDRAAARSGAARYASADDMLAKEELDAVWVTTPTPTHAELGCTVLEAGWHLYVEKPLAFTRAQAIQLARTAARTGKFVSVGHQWRYLTGLDTARDALEDHPVSLVHAWNYWTWPLVGWIADARLGGGQVMDQGIHLIDLARRLVGEITPTGAAYTRKAREKDDFPNWDAQVVTGRVDTGAVFSMVLTYALFPGAPDPVGLDIVAKDLLVRITGNHTTIHTPQRTLTVNEPRPPGLACDRAFVDACLTGSSETIRSPIEDALRSIEVVFACNDQAGQSGNAHPPLPSDFFDNGL